MRLSGVAEGVNENCMNKTLTTLNNQLNLSPPLTASDIDRLHRTGRTKSNGSPRQVLIKFARYQDRQRVIQRKSKLRDTNLFLSEDLSKLRNNLLYMAREKKREKQLQDCWSIDGRIMVKTLDGLTHKISNPSDLQGLFSDASR